jgi:hypothetical protein
VPAAEAEAAKSALKDPEFKKEATKVDFEKAKGLLEAGKAKQAEGLFKKAKADAKSKEDKDVVDAWILTSTGSQALEKLKGLAKQGKLHAAHEEALTQLPKYEKTHAAATFKEFIAGLEEKLYLVVQTFESPLKERDGKSYIDDPKLVFEGKHSLRWQNTEDRKAVPVRIEGSPRDWREFEAVEFHVKVTQAPGSPEAVLICAEEGAQGKAAKKATPGLQNSFNAAVKLPAPGSWERVRIPLSDFRSTGMASLSSIAHFQLQCAAGRQFDLLMDRVVLVRKDPAPGAAGAKATKGKPAGKG